MSGEVGDHISNFMVDGPQAGAIRAAESLRLKCLIVVGPPQATPLYTVVELQEKGLMGMYRGEPT